jgi:hypothetical protein
MLEGWEELMFEAGAGVRLSDGVPSEPGEDSRASQGTLLFNAWLSRMLQVTLGDETTRMGLDQGLPGDMGVRALVHLLESEPKALASYDEGVGDSILFDDMATDGLEGREERIITALLDAAEWLALTLSETRDDWRWGLVHTARLEPIVAGLGMEGVPAEKDEEFPRGFPRHGDLFSVDSSAYELNTSMQGLSFRYRSGPSLRLVVEMTGQGPSASVAIAGEQSVGVSNGVAGEEVDYWRTNLRHGVPFAMKDVVAAAKVRIAFSEKK